MKDKEFVVGIGETLWDMLPDGKKLGGAPANFAYHASQFGLASRVVSAVGRDELGDKALTHLDRKGLEHLLVRVDYPTGTVEVTLEAGGIPRYDIKRDVAWDHIPFTPEVEELARRTQAVCFGSLAQREEESRRTIHRFLEAMPRGEGRYRVFDVNLRQDFYTREVLEHSMRQCDVLKLNDEELEIVGRMEGTAEGTAEERCRELMGKYGLRMLILTCGTRGSYVFAQEGTSFAETPQVEVADTVGAGDSFTATFVASLLQGKDVRTAHLRATRVAAYVCSQEGAMPKLPEELRAGD